MKQKSLPMRWINGKFVFRAMLFTTLVSATIYQPTLAAESSNHVQQNIAIKGVVLDENKQPVVGATIKNMKTGKSVTSGSDGSFIIEVKNDEKIQISFVGYNNSILQPDLIQLNTIVLESNSQQLGDVVVVGYVKKDKSQIVSSISTVSSKDLMDVTSPNTANLLQGKAAGVTVSSASGQPGKAPNITIRGRGTIGANANPLTVVDGLIGGVAFPSDIESVTVLKDAGATGLYGSRAANGVIVITTKHGQDGKTRVNYSGSAGFSQMTQGNFSLMNGQQLYNYLGGLYSQSYQSKRNSYIQTLSATTPNPSTQQINDYLTQQGFSTTESGYLQDYLPSTPGNTNWLKEAFRTAAVQSHAVGVSGGNEKTKFYIGAAYYNEKGTLINTGYRNINTRINLEHKLSKKITLTARINTGFANNEDEAGGALYQSYINMPWDNPYDANGNPKLVTQGQAGWYGRDGSNFVYDDQYNTNKTKSSSFNGDLKLDYKITDWLSFATSNRYTTGNSRNEIITDARSSGGISNNGSLYNNYTNSETALTSNLFSFNKSFGKHNLNAIAGFEYQENNSDGLSATGLGIFPSLDIMDVISTPSAIGGTKNKNRFISQLFMADYNYDNRYFGTISGRADGSSVFGANNLYGLFYSIAGGWIVSNEKWFDSKIINELKLRGSYGVTGNTPVDNFGSLDLYSFTNSYAGISGAIPTQLANPLLTWEKPTTIDFGANINLWKRLDISFDIYQRTNRDLLQNVPLSAASGFSSINRNVGSVRNRGLDIEISSTNIKTSKLEWKTNFNISFNQNRILELSKNQPIDQTSTYKYITVGKDINSWYLREWAGVDPATGRPMWKKGNTTTLNYNDADPRIVGTATPKFAGGIGNSIRYGQFTLSAFINFVYGGKVYNSSRELFDADGAYPTYNTMNLQEGWTRWENVGDIATHPQSIINGSHLSNKPSSRYLEDGSYARLRNITLSYNLPKSITTKLKMENLGLFISADNLMTITKFSGIDPEVDYSTGNTGTKYPLARKFLFGINFTL